MGKKFQYLFSINLIFTLFSWSFFSNASIILNPSFSVESQWSTGYTGKITIQNSSSTAVSSWQLEFELPQGHSLDSLWNGIHTQSNQKITVTNETWNGDIQPGASVAIGFGIIHPQGATPSVLNISSMCVSNNESTSGTTDQTSGSGFALSAQYTIANSWQTGFQANITIVNNSSEPTSMWSASFDLPAEASINCLWNGIYTMDGQTVIVTNPAWSDGSVIQAGGSISFGFTVITNGAAQEILNLSTMANSTTGEPSNETEPLPTPDSEVSDPTPDPTSEPTPHDTSDNTSDPSTEPKEYKVIGYFPNWAMYRHTPFRPEHVDASLVTHINYAFVNHDEAGNLILFDPWADVQYGEIWSDPKPYWGHFRQLYDLKQKHPHLKTLFSVGGWTLSKKFSPMAADPQARTHFVQECINFCEKYDFDGVDLDWEYPNYAEHNGHPEDTVNFTLLLKELHEAAKAHSPQLLVTIAAPAGPWHYENVQVSEIHKYLDWINLMCYDFYGAGWSSITNHNAPLYSPAQEDAPVNGDAAVQYYLSQGVPKEKLVVGLPIYGRSFGNVQSSTDGLFAQYDGPGKGSTEPEPGMRFYFDIKNNLLPLYTRYWDDQAKVPYLYNQNLKEFVGYDDPESLAIKCNYVKAQGLAGAMVWELGLDTWPLWECMKTINNTLKS